MLSSSSAGGGGANTTNSTLYTRSALLQWANKALTTSYATLDAIPAKDIALLLNAINGHAQFPLNKIEFADHQRPDAQKRNCEVVVAQAASHLGYAGRLNPSLWYAKEDTANELLFWRWVRQSAEAKGWHGAISVGNLQQQSNSAAVPTTTATPPAPVMQQRMAASMPTTTCTSSLADSLAATNFLVDSNHYNFDLNNANAGAAQQQEQQYATSEEPYPKRPPRAELIVPSYAPSSSSSSSVPTTHHMPTMVTAAAPTPAPTTNTYNTITNPARIAATNAAVLQQTATAIPISRDAEAYHSSLQALSHHVQQQQQQQQMMMMQEEDQQYGGNGGAAAGNFGNDFSSNNTNHFNPATLPTDPYIAALIDAKNDKLLHLQSLRSRLIAACHAKDRSRVMEVLCEYMRGGGGNGALKPGEERLRMLV